MFISHIYVFFGEMSVEVFCPLFDWVVCFSGIELHELLVPRSQASSRGEAKDTALLLSIDGYLLEPTE